MVILTPGHAAFLALEVTSCYRLPRLLVVAPRTCVRLKCALPPSPTRQATEREQGEELARVNDHGSIGGAHRAASIHYTRTHRLDPFRMTEIHTLAPERIKTLWAARLVPGMRIQSERSELRTARVATC